MASGCNAQWFFGFFFFNSFFSYLSASISVKAFKTKIIQHKTAKCKIEVVITGTTSILATQTCPGHEFEHRPTIAHTFTSLLCSSHDFGLCPLLFSQNNAQPQFWGQHKDEIIHSWGYG